jgi:Rieske Fe-S protein
MSDGDKYPVDSDRRRFVKGVVGGSVLMGVGTTASAVVNTLTSPSGTGGGQTNFKAMEKLDGPAPRGMPQIPVDVDDEGFLRGAWPEVQTTTQAGREVTVARTEDFRGTGTTYSAEWFQYCGVQTYPGVVPGFAEDNDDVTNYFRYASGTPWLGEVDAEAGDRMHVDHFSDYESWTNQFGSAGTGKPAPGSWRSEGLDPSETMPIEVIRSPRVEQLAAEEGGWAAASTDRGFVAHLNKCTHFCCVPGFKTSNYQGAVAATDKIYCQCHQTIYDPFSIVDSSFIALPRPDS